LTAIACAAKTVREDETQMTLETGKLSNSAIALLFEIGSFDPDGASAEQKTHLHELISGGYITIDSNAALPGERYRLTAKANQFLAERGAGLNEA
jgi:hypothetical protein